MSRQLYYAIKRILAVKTELTTTSACLLAERLAGTHPAVQEREAVVMKPAPTLCADVQSNRAVRGPRRRLGVIACSLIVVCTLSGCVEAEFYLAPDSPLPSWFTLPPGLKRADVSVKQDVYDVMIPGLWGRTAVLTFSDKQGRKIDQVTASMKGEGPRTLSGDEHSYPAYEIMTTRGVTEVIEFRVPSDIFYVNDDPQVRAKLGLAPTIQQPKAD